MLNLPACDWISARFGALLREPFHSRVLNLQQLHGEDAVAER